MNINIVIAHYIAWAALLISAGFTLRAYRGVSLLCIYSVSLAIQVGTLSAIAGDVDVLGIQLSNIAMDRFGLSLVITYAILIAFIYGLYLLRGRSGNPQAIRPVTLTGPWMILGVTLVIGVVAVRIFSATGQSVLQHGLDSLGTSSEYYDLRIELIDIGNANLSRVASYFEATARQLVMLMLFIAGVVLAAKPTAVRTGFYLLLLAGLSFNCLLMLQKSPIFMALVAGFVPFLLPTSRSKRPSAVKIAVRVIMFLTVVLGMSAVLYSVTEGYSVVESLGRSVNRIILVPANTSCMHFEVYPDLCPHVFWTDLTPVRLWLGATPVLPPNESISMQVASVLTGSSFNANASIVGESWASAGYWGVVTETVVMGLFCFLVDRFMARTARGISLLPLGIYYWFGFGVFGNGTFIPCVVQHALWLVPGFYCLVLHRQRPSVVPAPSEGELYLDYQHDGQRGKKSDGFPTGVSGD